MNHPTYYTVRVYNCRTTDVFVKGVYLNGTFGTCVLVPARARGTSAARWSSRSTARRSADGVPAVRTRAARPSGLPCAGAAR